MAGYMNSDEIERIRYLAENAVERKDKNKQAVAAPEGGSMLIVYDTTRAGETPFSTYCRPGVTGETRGGGPIQPFFSM